MFSVQQYMEEGIKFIIPPPKYHPPFPNLLHVLEQSFISEKMSPTQPYHRLPEEDNTRPSMETIAGEDQRLLDTGDLHDVPSAPSPKKEPFKAKLSYHPTSHLRLITIGLFIGSFSALIASKQRRAIPALIFLGLGIARNLIILWSAVVGRNMIRIRIEIAGQSYPAIRGSTRSPIKKTLRLPSQRLVQVLIDWTLILLLILSSVTGNIGHVCRQSIPMWVALPIMAISSIDMGNPRRLSFAHAIYFDTRKEKSDGAPESIIPRTYQDVEASGGLQGDMTCKTGAESPSII